jgi:hypothetical protein
MVSCGNCGDDTARQPPAEYRCPRYGTKSAYTAPKFEAQGYLPKMVIGKDGAQVQIDNIKRLTWMIVNVINESKHHW